jgi:oligopeptide transport system permease protein
MSEPKSINTWQRLLKRPMAIICMAFLVIIVFAAILGSALTGYEYQSTSDFQYAAPSAKHWMGTDQHGRDLLTRILFGARISIAVGIIGALVSLIIGVPYGMISGYFGKRTDTILMRIIDILQSLPRILFVIVMITGLEKFTGGFLTQFGLEKSTRILLLFAGIGAMEWLTMARIVRGQVLSLKEQQFVLAAKVLGAPTGRILQKHILPNLGGIIIIYLTLTIPQIILTESLLSFLGLGIKPPQSSWGSLISEGAAAINPIKIYWWLIVFPGSIMALTLLSLNVLGDHLRDILDPRTAKL